MQEQTLEQQVAQLTAYYQALGAQMDAVRRELGGKRAELETLKIRTLCASSSTSKTP